MSCCLMYGMINMVLIRMVPNSNASHACAYPHVRIESTAFLTTVILISLSCSVYELRPKPYGVELTSWCYDEEADDFKELKDDTTQE